MTPRLAALVRKALIRSDKPQLSGEDAFRFRHLLIRDAAYDALPKGTRADLHERFAFWLEEHGAELVELDELLGYHLEQTCGYRAELGMTDDGIAAAAARRHLMAGGRRAALRQDYTAAVGLLERAAALVPPDELDLALEIELGEALPWTGRAHDAVRRAEAFAEQAAAAGDRVGELCGSVQAAVFRIYVEPEGAAERLAALVELRVARVSGCRRRHGSLHRLLRACRGGVHARADGGPDAGVRAGLLPCSACGPPTAWSVVSRAGGRFFGTTPVSELLAWLDENEPRAGRDHLLGVYRAGALAMLGSFDEARAILADARAELAERGGGVLLAANTAFFAVWVELWAGDPAAAATLGQPGSGCSRSWGAQLAVDRGRVPGTGALRA